MLMKGRVVVCRVVSCPHHQSEPRGEGENSILSSSYHSLLSSYHSLLSLYSLFLISFSPTQAMFTTSIMQPAKTERFVYAPREHQIYEDLDELELDSLLDDLQTNEEGGGATMLITLIPNPLATTPNPLATQHPLAVTQPMDHFTPVSPTHDAVYIPPTHENADSPALITPAVRPKSITTNLRPIAPSLAITEHAPLPPLDTEYTANNKRQRSSISTSSGVSEEEIERHRR
jgi:hypothetical protein